MKMSDENPTKVKRKMEKNPENISRLLKLRETAEIVGKLGHQSPFANGWVFEVSQGLLHN